MRLDEGGGSVCVFVCAVAKAPLQCCDNPPSCETVYQTGSEASGLLSLRGILVLVISCATWLTIHGELVFQTRT